MPPPAMPTENGMNRSPFTLAVLAGIGLSFAAALYAPTGAARGHVLSGIGIDVTLPPTRFQRVTPLRHATSGRQATWA